MSDASNCRFELGNGLDLIMQLALPRIRHARQHILWAGNKPRVRCATGA